VALSRVSFVYMIRGVLVDTRLSSKVPVYSTFNWNYYYIKIGQQLSIILGELNRFSFVATFVDMRV